MHRIRTFTCREEDNIIYTVYNISALAQSDYLLKQHFTLLE